MNRIPSIRIKPDLKKIIELVITLSISVRIQKSHTNVAILASHSMICNHKKNKIKNLLHVKNHSGSLKNK